MKDGLRNGETGDDAPAVGRAGHEHTAGTTGANANAKQRVVRRGRTLPLGKRLLFSLAILVAALGGAELVCRVLGLGAAHEVAAHVSDWHRMPDGRSFWVVRGPGRNADGMRDRDHDVEKAPGLYRIVFLGDSVTVGFGVARSQAYPTIFESFLHQSGVSAEVLNIAVSGWATLQQTTAYEAIARRYHPDHVFLGFCLNDVAEMHNNLTEPPAAVMRFLLRRSALFRWLTSGARREIGHVRELFDDPEAPAVQEGWRLVFDELLRLKELTRADGCDLSVIVFPFRFQLEADAPQPLAQRRLFTFCFEHGVPCLDLLPALSAVGPDAFIDESHLSQAGAAAVAEALIRWGRSGCMMCGYDLSGVTANRCPRCGYAVER